MSDAAQAAPVTSPEETAAPLTAAQRRAGGTFRALRHRNFRLFFSGQIISLVGTWMQNAAQAWLIYRMTGSPALPAVLGFVRQVPIFRRPPVGGLVADRWSRHRVVIGTQTASMLLAFILTALTMW